MKKILIIVIIFTLSFTSFGQSVSIPEANINPAPLETLELNGTGTGSFILAESSGLEVPALDPDTGSPNVVIEVIFQLVELTDGDTSAITGTLLNYFIPSYDAISNVLTLSQYATIAGDDFGSLTFPITVIENSSQEDANNGFQTIISASDNNTFAGGSASIFTYTADNNLSLIKSQTSASGVLNDIITYDIVVTNSGNTNLTDIVVTDDNATIISGNPIAELAPGDSVTVVAEHQITQADVDLGYIENSASAIGSSPIGVNDVIDISDAGTDVNGLEILNPETIETPNGDGSINSDLTDDPTVTAIERSALIALIKEGTFNDVNGDGFAQAGETVTYNFTVTNIGNVTITNIVITDPMVAITGGPIDLLVGGVDTDTFSAIYTITQADVDGGGVTNQALATGQNPDGVDVTDTSDDDSNLEDDETITTFPTDGGAIALIKTGTFNDVNGDGFAQAGETVTYNFTVTNTGNVTITNIVITDPMVAVTGGPIDLVAGASDATTFSAVYTITQADVDGGGVTNQALATGQNPDGVDVTDTSDDDSNLEDDETITTFPTDGGAIALIKTGTFNDVNGDGFAQAGETVTYNFTVTNTGNVTITNIVITDPMVAVTGGPIDLVAGASDATTFSAVYTITQADVDGGGVTNQALATGQNPDGVDVTDTSDDNSNLEDDETITTFPTDGGAIALIKTGTFNDVNGDGFAQAGETVTYNFTVTNTGNVTITNIVITDPMVAVTGGPIDLVAGASDATTFSAVYTITQADVDGGGVTNQALATGQNPDGVDVTDTSDDDSNLEDDETITTFPTDGGAIALIKTGTFNDVNGDGFAQAGETVTYNFTVTNTGNVTITNIVITDPIVAVIGGPIDLVAGASDTTTFSAVYTITQADVDGGGVTNQALATGQNPDGVDVTDTSDDDSNLEDDETITTFPTDGGAIALIKTGTFNDVNGDGFAQAGETVTYNFTVTNTGNVTITNIVITDPIVAVIGGPIDLVAGASDTTTFSAVYTITQADVDGGGVTNQALATGQNPDGVDVTDTSDDDSNLEDDETITTFPTDGGAIALIKTGTFNDVNGDGFAQAGETVTYNFTVTNTGNVTITNIVITDPMVAVTGGPIDLVAGASDATTFSAVYTITQADVDGGGVTNQALATGQNPDGVDVTDTSDDNSNLEDDETITTFPTDGGAIALIKTGTFNDVNGDGFAQAGETVTYNFTVTNTGNVTITNIVITDPIVAVIGGPIDLVAGASDATTFSAVYTITQADVDGGGVTNQALATGQNPDGVDVTDTSDDDSNLEDDETITTFPTDGGAIALIKTGSFNDVNGDGFAQAGETVTYNFTVTNTGNVTITNIVITDPMVAVTGGPIDLVAGASDATTFSAVYTITQADVDGGGVTNQALATGQNPDGVDVTDTSDDDSNLEDDETITTFPTDGGAIGLIKTGSFNDVNGDGFAQAGETVTYNFTVTNTGNVTITNIVITDPMVTVIGGPIDLVAGALDATTFSAVYTITQADIDNGGVTNQALATGQNPDGVDVTDTSDDDSNLEDDETITTFPTDGGAIALIKTGTFNDVNGDGFAQAGETVTYNFTVTNTGNVTITNIVITDPIVAVTGGPIDLVAGALDATTFSAVYTITQADIDNGGVTNQALATGQNPDGVDVTDTSDDDSNLEDDETITTFPTDGGAIALIKTGTFNDVNGDGFAQAGETVTYNFTVTNTGNVTITNIVITDPIVAVIGGPIDLVAGASDATTFSAVYTITQADVDGGGVTNQALATGQNPDGVDVTDTSDDDSNLEDDETITTFPTDGGAIALIKTGTFNDVNGDGFAQAGETVTYNFTVTNTGNVTITNIVITDPMVTVIGGPIDLVAGASDATTFSAVYTITQADVDGGGVTNQALATGQNPDGVDVTDTSDDNSNLEDDETITTFPTDAGSIALIKTGFFNDESGDGFAQVGETVTYNFTVTNTGNVTITNIVITDPMVAVTGGPIDLVAGASDATTFSAVYTITQADVDGGGVTNQALATGQNPDGVDVTDTSDDDSNLEDDITVTDLPQGASISLIKTAVFNDIDGDGFAQVGETITYNFTVTNTGNVTVTNIIIEDPLVIVSGGPIDLEPGETDSTTFVAVYTIVQSDIDEGFVTNQAIATGQDPDGVDIVDISDDNNSVEDDETVTNLPIESSIALEKVGETLDINGDSNIQDGEVILYTFTVTNTGLVPLENIIVTDPLVTVDGGPISLLPGESDSTTFTATYILTAFDITNGFVINQAIVDATDSNGIDVTDLSDDPNNDENVDPNMDGNPDDPTRTEFTGVLNIFDVEVFNGVSPDGDGVNDFFIIEGINAFPDNNVQIFNRWGVQVFEQDGYTEDEATGFKGISEGRATLNAKETLPEGTYYYLITYQTPDGLKRKSGYLYINR
ncbi:gliding motility-associated C-terminal domain-containing protein [uncultured Dokdonia sp.]|uniref:gliding motility-associated C-terminal domain-containing protein n=1 Tax=uncultured Dokdonia sp. TaxID=575653 RepID=UPI00262F9175|nr:gliding motility-associated C-terminal domain-containing protein [uncultured Dokdonia sp.]